jgi:hypothetical protein
MNGITNYEYAILGIGFFIIALVYMMAKEIVVYLRERDEEVISENNEVKDLKSLLSDFDSYSQNDNEYMGSPFREKVLEAISEK